MTTRFRLAPIGLLSAVAATIGILLLLQQMAVAYPTRNLSLLILGGMLLSSQVLPNLPARAAGAEAPTPAPTSAPTPAAASWTATHTVPDSGLEAWGAPDPSQPAVTTLAAGVELRLVERTGDWARVEGVNGWTGWVDARRLVTR